MGHRYLWVEPGAHRGSVQLTAHAYYCNNVDRDVRGCCNNCLVTCGVRDVSRPRIYIRVRTYNGISYLEDHDDSPQLCY